MSQITEQQQAHVDEMCKIMRQAIEHISKKIATFKRTPELDKLELELDSIQAQVMNATDVSAPALLLQYRKAATQWGLCAMSDCLWKATEPQKKEESLSRTESTIKQAEIHIGKKEVRPLPRAASPQTFNFFAELK